MSRQYSAVIAAVVFFLAGFGLEATAGEIDDLILNHEVSVANFFGINARSMALGQTGIASSVDGSAMIYNPACLARIRRLEVAGGFSHLRLENTTDYDRGRYTGYTSQTSVGQRDMTRTHLDALSVAVPVPTYRGSLVWALGLYRVKNFDRTLQLELRDAADAANYIEESQTETETGGIYAWTAAGAMEISPKLSAGAALHIYTGKDKYGAVYYSKDASDQEYSTIDETSSIVADHLGISGTIGFTYQTSPYLTIGAVIETPSFWNVEEDSRVDGVEIYDTLASEYYWEVAYGNDGYTEYDMRHPFSFGLGAAVSHNQLNLALDLKYTDYSQFEYTDDFSQDLNAVIQENYKEVVAVGFGAEYVFPEPGISLRAGAYLDPLPFPSEYIEKDRQYFTLGVGFLIDRVMTIDIGAVLGGYTINYLDPLPSTEEYKTRRIYLTMGYRM
jgi:long-subunit fatty acid transport protein